MLPKKIAFQAEKREILKRPFSWQLPLKTTEFSLSCVTYSLVIIFFFSTSFKKTFKPDYGPWRTTSCYSGLDFCVKRGSYNESAGKYEWWVKFRNRYKKDASFNCVLKASNIQSAKGSERVTVRAGSEGGNSWFLVAEANVVNLFVDSMRYGEDDWGTPYVSCDN